MKRNTRLYHIPAVLYVSGSGEINLAELYGRGFADVATAAGLKINPKSKFFKKPTSFLKEVTALSRGRLASGRILYKS